MQQREGPCYDAFVSGKAVIESDLVARGRRWPGFGPRAVAAGFRSVYGYPLRLRDDVIGALNMFRREPGTLEEDEVTIARTLADATTIGIMHERVVREARMRAEQLQRALDGRVVIEQAKGIIAERLAVSPSEAFERIRSHARAHRRRIHGVAREIVAGDLDID
jgi:GAF domain-containing protein